jgi:hypothetical protein
MQKKIVVIIFSFFIFLRTNAQFEQYKNCGFQVGFVSAIGTHFQRLGFVTQAYYVNNFAQINASFRVYDNFKNLGPKGEYLELCTSLGLVLGYGKMIYQQNYFISCVSNQTGYKNSVSYCYTVWYNKIKTSQVTGIIAFQFNQFSIISENDLLAKPILDRFRTGAILLQYQDKYIQYSLNCTMWTGKMGITVRNDTLFPSGYVTSKDGVYSNISHGLLSGQVKFANEYGQYFQLNAGIDAEQVRNTVQNKLIHDMAFLPRRLVKSSNCHIPMLDVNNEQFLKRPNQHIKKPTLFLNTFTSPSIFY